MLKNEAMALFDKLVRDFKTASRGARNEWMAVESDLGY